MPVASPFHARTAKLCASLAWKEWSGYHAVRRYGASHEPEYLAIRHAAALIDVSPLFKYEVVGPGAADLLSRVMVRDIARLRAGRVAYTCWCDDEGMVLDDGTVARLDRDHFRVTSNLPAASWLARHGHGLEAEVTDVTESLGVLALQGPFSREIVAGLAGPPVAGLKFFGVRRVSLAGTDVEVSRTGYTGDLGYEVWVPSERALGVWDALAEAGRARGLLPTGLDAMDVARLEAGFVLNGVDYHSANRCPIDSRKSTPYEIGLGWTVALERGPFTGQAALARHAARGPRHRLVGLEYAWDEYEALFAAHGLPATAPGGAWRDAVPVYAGDGRQVGHASSGCWSPVLKRNIALATLEAAFAGTGAQLNAEVTVEYERHRVPARVVETPFYDPPRKRA